MEDLDSLLDALEPAMSTPAAPTPRVEKGNTLSPQVSQSAQPLSGGALESLLSDLTDKMDNLDTNNPSSRGLCFSCRQSIVGEMITAGGHTFHATCFICSSCRTPLGTGSFGEKDGRAYCQKCFSQQHLAKCAHCNLPILDRSVTAIGKKWHIDHFICTQCLKPFPGGQFFERDGRPYCEQDFYSVFAQRCASCNQAIKGDCINALGSTWHSDCFVCQYCKKPFSGGTYFNHNGQPFCEQHYHAQMGSICAGCGKSISGRAVSALDKKWHPEHFVCGFCSNQLTGGAFTEQNGKAYCKDCHGKLFG